MKKLVNESKCPNCNSLLEKIEEGHSIIIKCPNCDYSIVGDASPEWYDDDTLYSIYFSTYNKSSVDNMKFIAKKLQKSIIKIKDLISSDKILYKKGEAWELKETIKELDTNKIKYEIEPPLKYQLN